MNKDIEFLAEAYDQVSKFIPITSDRAKYIIFPDENEAYQVDPFKKLDMKHALKDKSVKNWAHRDLVIGEDIIDIYPNNKSIDTAAWYIVPNTFQMKELVHPALVGYIASL
jgi:hypothetical protein